MSRDSWLWDLIIGQNLIPLFPEMPYIPTEADMSRDDLDCDMTIGQHLILLFPQIFSFFFF